MCLLGRPPKPLNFTVTNENTTTLKLSWNVQENMDGEINYYIVRLCR